MARGDGDGWVTCSAGHPHWGKHGAAGLLLRCPADDPARRLVLVQLRADWSHHGGTWGLLGGARDSHESVVEAALREAVEEGGISPDALRVASVYTDDHGGWSYTTVLADATEPFPCTPANTESDELRWLPEDDLTALPLHPHFALSWPTLRDVPAAPLLVVDAANVVGSRPDGWWHDRLGAARRLRSRLGRLGAAGLSGNGSEPFGDGHAVADRWFTDVVMVVEGAARPLATEQNDTSVRTVAAPGSGDDAIVDLVAEHATDRHAVTVVVTADRALRQRCATSDPRAVTVGPGWLYSELDAL